MNAGDSPRFLKMVYLFRIPPWYKLTALTIYSISGYLTFDSYFQNLSLPISFTTVVIFSTLGIWMMTMWGKNILVDTDAGVVKVGDVSLRISEIEDIVVKKLSVKFILKSGDVISFRYPVEDAENLKKVLKGVNV